MGTLVFLPVFFLTTLSYSFYTSSYQTCPQLWSLPFVSLSLRPSGTFFWVSFLPFPHFPSITPFRLSFPGSLTLRLHLTLSVKIYDDIFYINARKKKVLIYNFFLVMKEVKLIRNPLCIMEILSDGVCLFRVLYLRHHFIWWKRYNLGSDFSFMLRRIFSIEYGVVRWFLLM